MPESLKNLKSYVMSRFNKRDILESRVYTISKETIEDVTADSRHLAADSARLKVLIEKVKDNPLQFHEVAEILERLNGVYVHTTNLLDVYSSIQYYLLMLKDLK